MAVPLFAQAPGTGSEEHNDPSAPSSPIRVMPRGIRPGMTAAQIAAAQAAAAGDPFIKAGAGGDVGGGGTVVSAGIDSVPAPAADSVPAPAADSKNFQLLFESYDVTRADFAALLLEVNGDDAALYARINEWVGTKRARLVHFSACSGRPENRSVMESIDEVRYPIEFNPPIAEEDYAFPTAYETRNAGETIEFEYALDQKGYGLLQFAIGNIRLARMREHVVQPGRDNSATMQPDFATRKISTTIILPMGGLRLAGTLSMGKEDTSPSETVRVVFVRSRWAAHAEKPKPKPIGTGAMRLEYSFFSLERAAARDLLLGQPNPQLCHDALRQLVQTGQARLEHVSTNVTASGTRTVTEEILETRYPIEYEAPAFPHGAGPAIQSSASASADKPEGGEADPNAAAKPVPPSRINSRVTVVNPLPPGAFPKKAPIPAVASTYETRNAGFTSEAEPVVMAGGMTFDVQLFPQFVLYKGPLQVNGIAKSYPPQPLFEARKFSGALFTVPGEQELISTYNFPADSGVNNAQDDGRVTLGFLRIVPIE